MKKMTIGLLLIVLFLVSCGSDEKNISNSIEEVIISIYSNEFDELKDLSTEEIYELDQARLREISSYFTIDLYENKMVRLRLISNLVFISTLESSTKPDSIEIDLRKLENGDYTCYFSYDLVIDHVLIKNRGKVEMTGVASIVQVDDEWKIDSINIQSRGLRNYKNVNK